MNAMIYKKKGPLVLFLVPTFLFLTMYLYYPFLMNIYNSLNKIGGLGESSRGLNEPVWENYVKMFTDPLMRTALKNTMILMILTVVFQVGIALVLALMVDNIKVGAKFFRTVYFFSIVISATALGLLFNLIFLYDGGMLNQLLQNLGLAAENIDWKDPAHFFVTMMVPVIWQYVGFYFVILVTGLNNISTDIYEAAEIDGASGLGRIRYITLPLLHNTLCTCLVLAITGSLKVFDLPWTMFVGGLPLDKSWLTGTYMYYQTMVLQDVDYGSAIAILIVVLGVIRSDTFSLPIGDKFTLENYVTAFKRVDIGTAYVNSIVISGAVTVVVMVLAGLAAYAMVRYSFRLRGFLHSMIIASMMFPVFSTIIPVFRMESSWGIVNTGSIWLTRLSVVLPQIAGNLSFAIIVLMGFIRSLPVDLEEAAYLEGYNVYQIFFRIIMPLAKPSFATVGIFTFLWSYNDLFLQMFFLRSKKFFTITRLLNEISSQAGTNYGLMVAAVVMVVIPVLVVYIFLQNYIIKGMTAGAVKG